MFLSTLGFFAYQLPGKYAREANGKHVDARWLRADGSPDSGIAPTGFLSALAGLLKATPDRA
jgi:hypothetical protein